MNMKVFWNWVIKNLSNIFSFIGILLTLYFGIYYVPNWLRESQNDKIENAHINLEQSIKELIYSETECELKEILPLIKAKELELDGIYTFSTKNLLTKVQDSFMQDKFLPLSDRKQLMDEIEKLKLQVSPEQAQDETETTKKQTVVYEWLSIIVSIVSVIVGILSLYLSFRSEKEKQEEIDNTIVSSDEPRYEARTGYEFEKNITNILKRYKGVEILRTSEDGDFGFDIEFQYNNQKYYAEVKYFTRSKVGLKSFHQFISNLKGLEGEFWFIYNTDLTDMVKRKAEETIKSLSTNRKIKMVHVNSPELFSEMLERLLSN